MTDNLDNLPDARKRAREAIKKRVEAKNPTKSEYLLKVCILGSEWNLRKNLITTYTGLSSDPQSETLGIDILTKKMIVKETPTKLILVNTAGQEFFGKLRPNYYRGASACLIVFDKSDRESFDAVPNWLKEFRKHIPEPDIPSALLGINTDEEYVSKDEGIALAELLDLPYFESSSPKFENAKDVFVYLAGQVIK